MEVGIRELKAHLSELLGRAGAGESIVITDRGRPVARLVPFSADSAVDRGIDEGWIEAPRRSGLGPADRHRSTISVLEVLDEDRG
jgi:prevent-host-death family protein